jgi:hypothetical protein
MTIIPCKNEHKPRINKLGVSWCILCGALMTNPATKKLERVLVNNEWVELETKNILK